MQYSFNKFNSNYKNRLFKIVFYKKFMIKNLKNYYNFFLVKKYLEKLISYFSLIAILFIQYNN